jgi:hypothetical protein
MGEPVPVLAVEQLLERTPAALVRKLQAEGVPVLVRRDRVLTYWDSSDYSTQVETQSGAALPGGRSQRPRHDDSPPTGAELEVISAQIWDEHLAREAADVEATEEREFFLGRIAAGVARAESGWVQCPDVCDQLDGEAEARVVHVLRWMQAPRGRPYGTLLQADGSPGASFARLDFCIPHTAAVAVLRRPGESDGAVFQRIRLKVEEMTDEAEAERARLRAQLDFDSPWRHRLARPNPSEDGQRINIGLDGAALVGSFWRSGENRPEQAPKAWIPLVEFVTNRDIALEDALAAASQGAFSLHLYARRVTVAYWPFGAPGSPAAKDFVARHDIELPGSGTFRRSVNGPVALGQGDLVALGDSSGGSVVTTRLFGLPFAQPGDGKDRDELTLLDPGEVLFRSSDLWIGPDGQNALRDHYPARLEEVQSGARTRGGDPEVRQVDEIPADSAQAAVGKSRSDKYEQRDIARIGLILRGAFPARESFARNGVPNCRAIANAVAQKQARPKEADGIGGDRRRMPGVSFDTIRKYLSEGFEALVDGEADVPETTMVVGALVALCSRCRPQGVGDTSECAELDRTTGASHFANAIRGVLPPGVADKPCLSMAALKKLVLNARNKWRK